MLVGEVFARMGLDSKQYEESLDRLEKVTKKRALTLGNIFKGALSVTIGMTMFEAVKRGFRAVVGESISFNAQMEQARIGFTTMLGSAEKAQKFLDDMADFAVKTPFEYPELLEAAKRMLAYGFAAEEVLPTLRAVGDASAALGSGSVGIDRITLALGQIRAKGKLSAEEMRQLTEAGVPAWHILADAMGKTVPELQDMVSKGLIPGYKAVEMLTAGMTKRFGGMMQSMENTWQGVTSSIKDIWRMTIGAVTQNLFQGVVSWLQKVRDFATGFYDTFRQYGLQRAISESFGPEVAAMVSVLGATLRGLASVVSAVTGFITQYGKQIKFAAIVMGTYLALTKAVTLAKQIMIAVTAVERGQLLAKIPVLNVVSTAMGIYRVQMALAAQQGVVLTGVIAKLRVALYSLWSALGPIGWIILGLSAAVGVGTYLWGKYTQSVYSGAKVHDELAEGIDQVDGSAGDAAGAIEDEADALKKAGKAANKNLQSFDEVHQLQEDMAGSAEDLAKSMGLDDTELGVPGAGGFEIPDISAQLEEMKPTLAGFWEWIKQGAANLWEGVKEKWTSFWEWVKSWGLWQWLADRWDGLKEWAGNVWEGVKERWEGFKSWVASWAGPLWDGIKEKWAGFKEWAGNMWEGVKEKWGNFTGWVQEKWSSFKAKAGEIWEGIKTNVQTKWEELKTNAPVIWENIKTSIKTRWENLKTSAGETWNNITTGIKEKWNNLKTNAPTVWENIKTSIQDRWEALKTNAPTAWENIRKSIDDKWEELKTNAPITWENIKKEISNRWEALKKDAPKTWGEIAGKLAEIWEGIKTSASEKWEGVKTVIKGAINGIIGFINKFIKAWNKIELKVPEIDIPLFGTVGGWSVRLPQIPEIPMLAKGGLVMDPTLAMLGEAGPEAVIPLGRSGFAGDLADTVAQAVYRAMMDAIRISQASPSQRNDDKELVLKIDNTVLARMQLPAIIREGQRQGMNLVVQGV